MKPVIFLGSSLDDVRKFSREVKGALGKELLRVQMGGTPTSYKPLQRVGAGAYEIRVHMSGAWRVIYVAKFASAIYVLNAFRKKTEKTAHFEIALARKRYAMIGEIE